MEIRPATVADLPAMERLAREFYASSRFLHGFDQQKFSAAWTGLLESGIGVIFGLFDRGEIAGVKTAHSVTGPYDVIAYVEADSLLALGDFIVSKIQATPGVLRTLTNVIIDTR